MDRKDDRDEKTWVVYELTSVGESLASEGGLEEHLESLFKEPDLEFFVPYLAYQCDGRITLFNVMEGYCFVCSGLDDRRYFQAAEDSPCLWKVLRTPGGEWSPTLTTVSNGHVESLRKRLCEMLTLNVGMKVVVKQGICKGLTGTIMGFSGDWVHVLISMRTLKTIRTISKYAVLPIGEDHV